MQGRISSSCIRDDVVQAFTHDLMIADAQAIPNFLTKGGTLEFARPRKTWETSAQEKVSIPFPEYPPTCWDSENTGADRTQTESASCCQSLPGKIKKPLRGAG